MDYEAVRAGLQQAVPFNAHVGLEIAEVGPGVGVVRLPHDPRLANHVGSQHAGALFSAGEAASGAAFVGTFADLLGAVTPLAESAEISYRKIAKGPITATGRLAVERDAIVAELDAEGRVRFPIDVALTDADDNLVAEMTVRWHLRRNA